MSLHSCLQAPSATVIVKGLSMKTNDDDLYQILVQVLHNFLHRF
jgi:RNA-binding protein 5/10